VHRKVIVLVQMHFIQCKQFSETNETSHAFKQISDLKIFPECFRGPLKMLWRATCRPRACSWTTLVYRICFCTDNFCLELCLNTFDFSNKTTFDICYDLTFESRISHKCSRNYSPRGRWPRDQSENVLIKIDSTHECFE